MSLAKGDWSMNTHVRLVSSEETNSDTDFHGSYDSVEARDNEPIGLPEEDVTSRSNLLGDTSPPLFVGREDRLAGARSAKVRSNTAFTKLLSLAWPPKTNPSAPNAGEETTGERRNDPLPSSKARLAEQGVDTEDNRAPDNAAALTTFNAKLPCASRKSAIVAALGAGVVIPTIALLNWPHPAPPPIVEPGMLADPAKLMAPSAAFATAPPREAPNVSRDRPIVHETRRDELSEMLSFKGADSTPAGTSAPATSSVKPSSPPLGDEATAQAPGPTKAALAASDSAKATSGASGSPVQRAASSSDVDAKLPAPQPAALVASPSPAAVQPQEPGLGTTAKIEARLTNLETALKDRSNEARARVEAEKAESHTLEKIA
jgi:hypothetical protein